MQGENFTEKHWMEMFSIIGIPYKNIEQLKFEDFILVKNRINEKLASLQVKIKKQYRLLVKLKFYKLQIYD